MAPGAAAGASAAIAAAAFGLAMLAGAGLRRRAALRSHEQGPYRIPAQVAAEPPAARAAHGRRLYLKSCAHCHGLDATGDEGPDLHGLWISDRGIATVIRRGIKGEMPSFSKKHDDTEIAELVAFVRSLQ
jgi:mono/diheme cytochrome c family protein